MKKLGFTKRIVAGMLMVVMAVTSLAGCNKKEDTGSSFDGTPSETKALVVGEYDVYLDELLVYAFQNLYLRGTSADSWNDSVDSTVKNEILSSVRECKILCDVATKNGYVLDEADMVTVETTSNNFINAFGEDVLEEYGISPEVVKTVFAEQALVSKFETEIKNDMGQTITADLTEDYKDFNFNTIYYMVFPTVEKDANDEPMVDDTGAYVYLSDADKANVKADAEAALEELRGGASYEDVADKYGITNYCTETSGYIGSYSDEINDALVGLETGDCTDIMEGGLGYIIIVMISANDASLKENYINMVARDYTDNEFQVLRNNWLATIPVDSEKDIEGTIWKDYPLVDIVAEIERLMEENAE